ncbi:hypothetical protein [Staphylococcus epidermidis]|uniref:hypothetical protein n=1 Tax=Staphylococcus epidermidis TaxID=1282 RepID=UPI0037DA5C4B
MVKEKNDEVCREDGLCVGEGNGRMGYSEGEKGLIEKGKRCWKEEIRDGIEE